MYLRLGRKVRATVRHLSSRKEIAGNRNPVSKNIVVMPWRTTLRSILYCYFSAVNQATWRKLIAENQLAGGLFLFPNNVSFCRLKIRLLCAVLWFGLPQVRKI